MVNDESGPVVAVGASSSERRFEPLLISRVQRTVSIILTEEGRAQGSSATV